MQKHKLYTLAGLCLPCAEICLMLAVFIQPVNAQPAGIRITERNMTTDGYLPFHMAMEWYYKAAADEDLDVPDLDEGDWIRLRPADVTLDLADASGRISGWFLIRVHIDPVLARQPLSISGAGPGSYRLYIDGVETAVFGAPDRQFLTDRDVWHHSLYPTPITFMPDREYTIAIRVFDRQSGLLKRFAWREQNPGFRTFLISSEAYQNRINETSEYQFFSVLRLTGITFLCFLFGLFFYQNIRQKELQYIAIATLMLTASAWIEQCIILGAFGFITGPFTDLFYAQLLALFVLMIPLIVSQIVTQHVPRYLFVIFIVFAFLYPVTRWFSGSTGRVVIGILVLIAIFGYCFYLLIKKRSSLGAGEKVVGAGLAISLFWLIFYLAGMEIELFTHYYQYFLHSIIYLTLPLSFLGYVSIRFNENLVAIKKNLEEITRLNEEKLKAQQEKQKLIESQNVRLEKEVAERTIELRNRNHELTNAKEELQRQNEEVISARDNLQLALENLRAAQDQLVQQEKLASLGQLTAGIAHEIKNPLNFVNNFSDVSLEMIDEALEELGKTGQDDHTAETATILADIKSNLAKIHEHGSRADGIVKAMLQHSRGGDGKMEPTDLNALVKEYVNLAYHGMRAGKDPIEVDIELNLDESIGEIPLIAEDFSRVILNLCNNAFDACAERSRSTDHENAATEGSSERLPQSGSPRSAPATPPAYKPRLTIRTAKTNGAAKTSGNVKTGGSIQIEIEDNGPGIPAEIKDKILQPFFTTKKGTQGTGLGLSISHDIVKAHGGAIEIESIPETHTILRIIL